ncbi:hypothetical protein CISIN_1g045784mg [Citrus sinensis]|uniref:Uncharacterized protein n=1 Tax=Citrus sinensis TaxID=2711 RepID=A0A067DMH8_CITSI|nr:hypothetical protein CISIN_1g045784mg [Citrus sinensis]
MIRVIGRLVHKVVTVLIDSRRTHNFVRQELAVKLNVMVASGERFSSLGTCLQTLIKLQGVPLIVDFYLLPFEGYDVVLDTQWLSTFGLIE